MSAQKVTSKPYIPGLDGLRALAVIAVILYHTVPNIVPGGFLGVDIFFVISGFLITTLLLKEKAKNGRIALRKFWVRRARRLLPALCTVIAVSASLALLVGNDALVGIGRQIVGAATFSSNWIEVAAGTDYFATTYQHLFLNFWSLAVEEQFYVIWPFFVVGLVTIPVLSRRYGSGLVMTLMAAIGSAVWMAVAFQDGSSQTRVYYGTDTHCFGLMIGAAVAFLSYALERGGPPRRLMQPFVSLLQTHKGVAWFLGSLSLVGLVLCIVLLSDQRALTYIGGMFVANVLAGVLIMTVVGSNTMWQRLFEWRVLKWIGVRSYGIYLWHWPLIVLATTVCTASQHWWAIGVALFATFVAAALSYRYIEQPVQRQGIILSLRNIIVYRRFRAASGRQTMWLPHPALVVGCIVVSMTTMAIIVAPDKTEAERRIEAGQLAIKQAAAKKSRMRAELREALTGKGMTVVGDSVTLASAPALQQAFAGIDIHATVSESLRQGGRDTIESLRRRNALRRVVVVAYATNAYYGANNLDALVRALHGHDIIIVTGFGDRPWIPDNNAEARRVASKYENVVIAPWDEQIKAHKDELASDGIHPTESGGKYYVRAIKVAVSQLQQR